MQVNREEFDKVEQELAEGQQLTFTKMARVFGFATYELILHALLSAEEASYVIREAIQAAGKEDEVSPQERWIQTEGV